MIKDISALHQLSVLYFPFSEATPIKLQTLQTVLDKAIHEVGDYKSLLARLTPSKG